MKIYKIGQTKAINTLEKVIIKIINQNKSEENKWMKIIITIPVRII